MIIVTLFPESHLRAKVKGVVVGQRGGRLGSSPVCQSFDVWDHVGCNTKWFVVAKRCEEESDERCFQQREEEDVRSNKSGAASGRRK